MSKGKLEEQVLEVLREIAPEAAEIKLKRDVSFRDQFDFDSVDFLSFVLALQKKLGVEISELDFPEFSSLEGCVSYLSAHSRRDRSPEKARR